MGLSRKLGNVANQRGLLPESIAIEYKWSTQSYTIQDIINKFKLPCVVQCATDQCSIQWSKFQFDLRYPLLLYSRRTARKIHARNLTTSTHEEFGPPMAIPEDYEGWFGATPKGTNQTKRHTRIEGIAKSNTLRFLVSTKCPAFTRSLDPDGFLDFVPRDIVPGETFKRVCVMDGDLDDPDTPDIIHHNGPCLECLDEKDDDILIPLSRRAIAYEISEFYPDANHKVFNVKSIVSAGNSKLPRIVSLVHGERPVLNYNFTGQMRCYSIYTEETILAATLDDTSPLCLEMTTDSIARFKLSLNETSIKRTCEYNNALHLCKTSGDNFSMGIKVSFSLQPEPEPDENDASACEIQSMSDMQEVDANSEFEIAWSSEQNTGSSKSNYKVKDIEKGEVSMTDNFILLSNHPKQPFLNQTEIKSDAQKVRSTTGAVREDLPNSPTDFTEQEIADLMVRKGILQGLGASSSSDLNLTEEIETLRRTRVKVNPIYYCNENESKTNTDQNLEQELVYSEIDEINPETVPEDGDIVEVSLDESEFVAAVCTKASEYHDDDQDSEDDGNVRLDGNGSNCGAIEEDDVHYVGNEESNVIEVSQSIKQEEIKDEQLNEDMVVDFDGLETQRVRRSASVDISSSSSDVEFLHGLNVTPKATSSDMMNKKKWWGPRKKGEGGSILHKFKSESNISKIFERFRGSEEEKSISSSKTRLLQLKPNKSQKNASGNNPVSANDDNFEAVEC